MKNCPLFFRALVPFFFTCSVIYMTLLIIKRVLVQHNTHLGLSPKVLPEYLAPFLAPYCVMCFPIQVICNFHFVGGKFSSKYIWFKAEQKLLWLPPITFEYFDVNFLQFQIDSNFAQVNLYSFFISLQIVICITHCNYTLLMYCLL